MEASVRSKSITLSLLIHGAIALILFLIVLQIPIPPFGSSGAGGDGVLIDIGTADFGSGTLQPQSMLNAATPVDMKQTTENSNEKILTSENSDAIPLDVNDKKENKKTDVKKITPVVKTVDQKSIYHGSNNKSTSQGNDANAPGDKGAQNGSPTNLYGKPGTGNNGGDGKGGNNTGPGGPGPGGFSFNLGGRSLVGQPHFSSNLNESGKVVVSITVDKSGKIISAVPGALGSTTTSSLLYAEAKRALLSQTLFNAKVDAAEIQKGTITIVFLPH